MKVVCSNDRRHKVVEITGNAAKVDLPKSKNLYWQWLCKVFRFKVLALVMWRITKFEIFCLSVWSSFWSNKFHNYPKRLVVFVSSCQCNFFSYENSQDQMWYISECRNFHLRIHVNFQMKLMLKNMHKYQLSSAFAFFIAVNLPQCIFYIVLTMNLLHQINRFDFVGCHCWLAEFLKLNLLLIVFYCASNVKV